VKTNFDMYMRETVDGRNNKRNRKKMATPNRTTPELKFMLKAVQRTMQKKQTELDELAAAADELQVQIQLAAERDKIIAAELAKNSAEAMQRNSRRVLDDRQRILTYIQK